MLGVNQSDFMSYMSALKSNYRKGVHRMEAILSNPTHAAEFAANLGGVSVVLGVPISLPDRNSDKLLELLLGSDVADDAVLTWMHQFYEFTDWDDLMGNAERCKEMANNPLIWRALGGSKLAVGKSIATLAGLSCADYADIDAVAASQVAMTAVAASQVAMAAIIGSSTALNAVVTSSVAMAAVAASQVAMAAVAASQVAMTAIVKSPVAMAAMWRSDTAIKALQANATAWKTFTGATSAVMGKTVAILANLDPSGYADMTAIAASQVAMAAVAASQVAMAAVAASQVAMAAIAASATARAAICASTVAYDYLLSKATYATISGTYSSMGWSTRYEKPCIVLQWCFSHNGGTVGIRTCLDGAASRTYQGSQRYNSSMGGGNFNSNTKVSGTYYKEFVFCSKLETYNSQSDWPAISIAYFPLP